MDCVRDPTTASKLLELEFGQDLVAQAKQLGLGLGDSRIGPLGSGGGQATVALDKAKAQRPRQLVHTFPAAGQWFTI